MKIVHAISALPTSLGGAEQYCLTIARAQAAAGAEVTILAAQADGRHIADLRSVGIDAIARGPWRPYAIGARGPGPARKVLFHGLDLAERRGIADWLPGRSFDVCHVHTFQGFGVGILASRVTPTVHTVHDFALVDTASTTLRDGHPISQASFVQRSRTRLIESRIQHTHVIFPSQRTRERHHELGLERDQRRQHVIPHGWPAQPSSVTATRANSEVGFLYLGKLEPHKGLTDLLEAWSTGIPGARLTIAGSGSLEPLVAAAAARGTVRFLGWVGPQERSRLLAQNDVLLMTSRWPENFPLVVAEGVLAGMAIVASSVSSPPLVDIGQNAVEYQTTPDLRRVLSDLAGDVAAVRRLQAGSTALSPQLDMGTHLAALERVYFEARHEPSLSTRGR